MAAKDKVEEVVADVEAVAAEAEGLVAVIKDGVKLFVHETCLAAHKVLGWKQAS